MSDILEEQDELEKLEIDENPYNIEYDLSSYGIDFDVSGLVRRLENKSIYLPDFQRNYVWSKKKAVRFIESLLLGLPIPSICLYKEDNNKQLIIDGFQRLETIRLFYSGKFGSTKFILNDVRSDLNGKGYTNLDEDTKRKLDDTLIHATIVKAEDPTEKNYDAVYLIFERLNTGGINLNAQEIRVCIYHGPFQKLLEVMASNSNYKKYFQIDSKRKKDQEIVLRLLALANVHEKYNGNMKQYLNEYMYESREETKDTFAEKIKLFEEALDVFNKSLPAEVFRQSGVINLAMADAIFVGTYNRLTKGAITDYPLFRTLVESIFKDKDFIESIQTGKTHHTVSIQKRLALSKERLNSAK